jgi:hypothetical protein
MVLVKEVSEGRVRDRSDHETAVLRHVVVDEMQWVDDGRYGLLDGQVESASKKIQEAIIITAKVKQMDSTGFLEVCGARAQGLTVVGKTGDFSGLQEGQKVEFELVPGRDGKSSAENLVALD